MQIRLARHSRHVAVVTVDNQPRLNAMTRAMLSELGRLWDELQRDGDWSVGDIKRLLSRFPKGRFACPIWAAT
jgi:enoyl-CoA hydratase/carnithine racemase